MYVPNSFFNCDHWWSVYYLDETHKGAKDLLKKGSISVARSFTPGNRCASDRTMEETFMRHGKSSFGACGAGLSGILKNRPAFHKWLKTMSWRAKLYERTLQMCGFSSPREERDGKHSEQFPSEIKKKRGCGQESTECYYWVSKPLYHLR